MNNISLSAADIATEKHLSEAEVCHYFGILLPSLF